MVDCGADEDNITDGIWSMDNIGTADVVVDGND